MKTVGCNRLAGSNPVRGAMNYVIKGVYFMSDMSIKKLNIENRIELLAGRAGRENGNIIKKLQRQLRKITAENK